MCIMWPGLPSNREWIPAGKKDSLTGKEEVGGNPGFYNHVSLFLTNQSVKST